MDIVKHIGVEALLGQLAEECCELAQAALKLQRIYHGTNPTPVSEQEARSAITEEATDVRICLQLLGQAGYATVDHNQIRAKKLRWEGRIRAAQKDGGINREP